MAILAVMFNAQSQVSQGSLDYLSQTSLEISHFTEWEKKESNGGRTYWVTGIVPRDGGEVKIKTLQDLGKRAAKITGIDAAIAFKSTNDIRGNDLDGLGFFSLLMDIIETEAEEDTPLPEEA